MQVQERVVIGLKACLTLRCPQWHIMAHLTVPERWQRATAVSTETSGTPHGLVPVHPAHTAAASPVRQGRGQVRQDSYLPRAHALVSKATDPLGQEAGQGRPKQDSAAGLAHTAGGTTGK